MVVAHRKGLSPQNPDGKYVTEITAGAHTFISDIRPKIGGTDQAPDPHELLESALAACTIMTVQLYADRKGWPLESTHVKVTIDKEGKDSHIQREVSFKGSELTQEQRAQLLVIADKCPIHKILMSQMQISTVVVD